MLSLTTTILIVTTTTTALIGGLFYAWSCSVMPGIGRLADAEFIASMQAMNRAILNPVFFLTFMGTAVLLPLSTYLHYGSPVQFWLLLAASAFYLVGVMGVTMVGNVPLNEALDAFSLQTASAKDTAAQRLVFEPLWNKLNTIRTVCSLFSIVLVVLACVKNSAAAQG